MLWLTWTCNVTEVMIGYPVPGHGWTANRNPSWSWVQKFCCLALPPSRNTELSQDPIHKILILIFFITRALKLQPFRKFVKIKLQSLKLILPNYLVISFYLHFLVELLYLSLIGEHNWLSITLAEAIEKISLVVFYVYAWYHTARFLEVNSDAVLRLWLVFPNLAKQKRCETKRKRCETKLQAGKTKRNMFRFCCETGSLPTCIVLV
jgi:hypothetical protein